MKTSNIRNAVFLLLAASALTLGCELIVDFDRTRIPADNADAAVVVDAAPAADATPATDASNSDAGPTDAATDG